MAKHGNMHECLIIKFKRTSAVFLISKLWGMASMA